MGVTKKSAIVKGVTPKFQQILAASGQELLDRRSQLIFKGASAAMEDHLTILNRRKDAIELEILNLTDLSVKTRDSLRPGNKDFNPNEWVAKMCELQTEVEVVNDDIFVAEGIQAEYFLVQTPEETK